MKSFRVWVMSALTLLSVGWLQADTLPVDPQIKYTTGGTGSTPIICPGGVAGSCAGEMLFTTLKPAIANGVADLGIDNNTGEDILSLTFFIPTTNFAQVFNAPLTPFTNSSTPDTPFTNVSVSDIESGLGCFLASFGTVNTPCVEVKYFGQGNTQGPPGLDIGEPDDFTTPPGLPGFTNGQFVEAIAITGGATPPAGDTYGGFLAGTHGELSLSVPEPSAFLEFFIVAVGLLAAMWWLQKRSSQGLGSL